MDIQILRAILQSHEDVMKDQNPEEFDKSMQQKFPITDKNILAAMCRSFTDLLSYKVSPEAHQRYSVRIQVIEILRDWLRPPKELGFSRTFVQGERVLDFVEKILRLSLTNETLFRDDAETDVLVALSNALITLSLKDKRFLVYAEKLLDKIAVVEQTENSRRLLLAATEIKDLLELGPRTIEKLYIAQTSKLVEEPLINTFFENLGSFNDISGSLDFKASDSFDQLMKLAANSPAIFQRASSILKEVFVESDYSQKVLCYIRFFLKSVESHCREAKKTIADLYPLRLQSCVLLLNIEPSQHTFSSREYVLRNVEGIHTSNQDQALILITHFPKWLRLFSDLISRRKCN